MSAERLFGDRDQPTFHGFAPEAERSAPRFTPPLTVAVSRQTGSRGRSIAKRVAELLGWQFIDQETLEYVARDADWYAGMDEPLDPMAEEWVEDRLRQLQHETPLESFDELMPLIRIVLRIGARGESVILGRGVGSLLPAESKLHVRLVAPLQDRIALIAQVERLNWEQAEQVVRNRDEARRQFITSKFGRSPADVLQYDLAINSSQFGVEASAAVIVTAAREKQAYLDQRRHDRGGEEESAA